MDGNQTLKDALVAAGDSAQVNDLTTEAQNLTKDEICDIFNGSAKEHVTIGTLSSLKKLVFNRISNGETAFPWKSMPGIKSAGSDLGGGFW
jgi:hypothetical protein